MKPQTAKVRKAAAKRMKESKRKLEGREDIPAPKRPTVRVQVQPSPPKLPPAPEIDLTADTPPERTGVEETREEAQVYDQLLLAEAEQEAGPSGAASSPPKETSLGEPPRPEPESAEVSERGRTEPTLRGFSLMNDGRRAEKLMSQVILPEFQEELRQQGASRFYREAFSAFLRAVNSFGVTRDAIVEAETAALQARRDAEMAEVRIEAAKKALEAAEARAEAAEKTLEVAEVALEGAKRTLEAARDERAAEVKEAAARAELEAVRLRAALNQLGEAESKVEARDLHIAELESAIRATEAKADGEARRALEAEAATEARVATAIEEYKASDRYGDELAEASAEAYVQGFREAREKVARVLNLPQAADIEPDEEPEEAPPSDEPAADL